MPFVRVNNINIYYDLTGPEDKPVLVLSNGIMMSTASWAFQQNVLNQNFQVLLYDCRGMWQSDHPPGPYSMSLHAEDLAALLSELGFHKAHIGGISYGAEISMQFAINYPEQVESLIIIDGVSEVGTLLRAQTFPWLLAAERKDPELLLRTSYFLNFGEAWIEENQAFIESSLARFKELDLESFAELMKSFFELNITAQLSSIQAPTLIVAGEEDLIKGRDYATIIHQIIPDSELVIIPGAGHALCLEKPDIINTLLLGFVTKYQNQHNN